MDMGIKCIIRRNPKCQNIGGGEYTEDLKTQGWIENGDEPPYKPITTNGKWEVIRFYHDGAFYSYCTECSYMHPCYKHRENFLIEYAPEKEFNYCPMCGMKMLEDS